MKYYRFPSNASWILFVDEESKWAEVADNGEKTVPIPVNIVTLLDDVKFLFETKFAVEQVNVKPLSILSTNDYPSIFKERGIIFLSARGLRWSKYAYQFAHELCHFIIPKAVSEQMRWFEESICELASLCFLYELSEKWKENPPYPSWQSYSTAFADYADNQKTTAFTLPDGISFAKFFAANIEMLSLEANCYYRDINTLCAKYLLPIFNENPELWREVPLIGEIPSDLSFMDSLYCWKGLSKNTVAIQQIINLFES